MELLLCANANTALFCDKDGQSERKQEAHLILARRIRTGRDMMAFDLNTSSAELLSQSAKKSQLPKQVALLMLQVTTLHIITTGAFCVSYKTNTLGWAIKMTDSGHFYPI